MSKMRIFIIYLLISVPVFGYALQEYKSKATPIQLEFATYGSNAFISALFWPYYLSAKIFER